MGSKAEERAFVLLSSVPQETLVAGVSWRSTALGAAAKSLPCLVWGMPSLWGMLA